MWRCAMGVRRTYRLGSPLVTVRAGVYVHVSLQWAPTISPFLLPQALYKSSQWWQNWKLTPPYDAADYSKQMKLEFVPTAFGK